MNQESGLSKKVIIGGTFDMLHKGHKALLRKAFELGEVFIGLVSDAMAKEAKKREVENFEKRKKELNGFLKEEFKINPKILEINDKFGFALKGDFDYIIVSPETYETALEINEEREKRNKKPIEIVKIDLVLAEDGKLISSNRIFNGEIDKEGKLLK